jgi:hypothetical protein
MTQETNGDARSAAELIEEARLLEEKRLKAVAMQIRIFERKQLEKKRKAEENDDTDD